MHKNLLILGFVVLIAACLAGCATTPPTTTPTLLPTPVPTTNLPPGYVTVNLSYNVDAGTYLTDAMGMPLYYFALDIPGSSQSICDAAPCPYQWTLFDAGKISVKPPLHAADFGTISTHGDNQSTYRGWPLYQYSGDTSPGEINGDGTGGIWFVMKPDYSVVIMNNRDVGSYLVDGMGNTLYRFSIDSPSTSACTNNSSVIFQNMTCIQLWPPFATLFEVIPSSLNSSDFTMFTRSDDQMQTAFRGMPLYYSTMDTAPGQTNGQGIRGFRGTWYMVSPADVATATPSSPTNRTPTNTLAS